jgi:hypothetical protein
MRSMLLAGFGLSVVMGCSAHADVAAMAATDRKLSPPPRF